PTDHFRQSQEVNSTEFILALIPPWIAIAYTFLTSHLINAYIKSQCERIGIDQQQSSQCVGVMTMTTQAAIEVTALLPSLIGFIVSAGVVLHKLGVAYLVLLSFTLLLVARPLMFLLTSTLYGLHRSAPSLLHAEKPSRRSQLQVIHRSMLLLN